MRKGGIRSGHKTPASIRRRQQTLPVLQERGRERRRERREEGERDGEGLSLLNKPYQKQVTGENHKIELTKSIVQHLFSS